MYFGFHGICAGYGKRSVLENINIELARGEAVSLIGTNGCGKSTLLKTVSGAVTPTSGTVYFDGKPIRDYRRRELARRISYLPQSHSAPPDLDVYTLVSYGRYPYLPPIGGCTKDDKRIIEKTLVLTGLSELSDRQLSTLSGGELQRAFIAMTVCSEPELLILDEPCAHLDIGSREEVLAMLATLRSELGVTVISVNHDINSAARHSDRLILIDNKRVFADGTPHEVLTSENLKSVFGIDALVLMTPDGKHPYYIPKT